MLKKNGRNSSVVMLLGMVHGSSCNPGMREFTVKVYNSYDLLPGVLPGDGLDMVPGYVGMEVFDGILESLRSVIKSRVHVKGVDIVLKEEEEH